MHEIDLAGCNPTPLASYLKALGVLRLVTKANPGTRAAWRGNHMVLLSSEAREDIEEYFLSHYRPTPILSPWNGGSGFYANDNKVALRAIEHSTTSRLDTYRDCLCIADCVLGSVNRTQSPKKGEKLALLGRLRGLLPDAALDWFDASVLIAGDSAKFPPLLGTGGNDGRLDFSNNFMQRLTEVINLEDGEPPRDSAGWLKMALYGTAAHGLVKQPIGQFSPGQVGGPNATIGLTADSIINPWDFVLMIEGTLVFAAAAVRRNADDPYGVLSYPFTVSAVGAGAGSLGESDAASARGELWMPLWRQPANYVEVRTLFAEGRVALGRKPARDALDFIRAVHRLGGYRGLDSFQRYGLLMRSGKAFLATPLARIEVQGDYQSPWLDDLDRRDWLTRFRRFARGETIATRYITLRKRLEDMLFNLAGHAPRPSEVQELLTLLGTIQAALARSAKGQEDVAPVPRLSERWVLAADDGSPAFRLACALAGLTDDTGHLLPLRAQLFPVHPRSNLWMDAARKASETANDPVCRVRLQTMPGGSLPETLIALLRRRLWLAERLAVEKKPLHSRLGASLDDVVAFIAGDHMDRRIADLMPGLSMCAFPHGLTHVDGESAAPAAFGLLKLCVTPDSELRRLDLIAATDRLPLAKGMLAQLVSGNMGNRAVRLAYRRLHASGIEPALGAEALPNLVGLDPRRVAAALLIPLRFGATATIARRILRARNDVPA